MLRRKALALVFATATLFSLAVNAKTVRDFEAMPQSEQSHYIADCLDKMITNIGRQNPALAHQIKDFFFHDQPGKTSSKGLWDLEVELAALDIKAKKGEVDLSKIQIEGVLVYITKQQFPPQAKP